MLANSFPQACTEKHWGRFPREYSIAKLILFLWLWVHTIWVPKLKVCISVHIMYDIYYVCIMYDIYNKYIIYFCFVILSVHILSRRNLSWSEISLLSKSLKFVPSANKIDRAKLKRELEEYGRKIRLMWYFRNERSFSTDKFRPKSSFNPRNKDTIIETYLSCLEERLLGIQIPSKR